METTEDTTDEPHEERFTLTLSGPSNATLGDATATGTIQDDDARPRVTFAPETALFSENGGGTTVTATLSNPSSEETTVTVSAAPVSPAVAGDFAPEHEPGP